jgi:N-acetylmuramoyl-L-alanine amidase
MRRVAVAVALVGLGLGLAACDGGAPARTAASGTTPLDDQPTTSPTSADPVTDPVIPTPAAAGGERVVVLDPGHNGGNAAAAGTIDKLVPAGGFSKPCNTTGTSTDSGYPEHAFTWDVARRAAKLLRAEGVTVVMTRDDDTGVGPCVDERAHLANRAKAALAVSVHADGATSDVRGFHVIEPAPAPDGGNRPILARSQLAATDLRAAFEQATGEPRATYPGSRVSPGLTRRDDLAGLNLARVPAVFIECANMRNGEDAAAVTSPEWRQKAAQGIADGVLAFLDRPRP